jgi:hypothetical protein
MDGEINLRMKIFWRSGFVLGLTVVALMIVVNRSAADETPWLGSSIVAEPSSFDLAHDQAVTLTVSLSNTGAPVDNLLSVCDLQSGEVLTTSAAVYPLSSQYLLWAGDISDTASFSLTIRPRRWPQTTLACAIIDRGMIQHVFTGTLEVTPFASFLPVVLLAYAPPVEPVVTFTYPAANWLIQSTGTNLTDTLPGQHLNLWRYDRTASTVNQHLWGASNYYLVRSLLAFDLSQLPHGRILSATLELYIFNSWQNNDFDLHFDQGAWSVPPSSADWDHYGESLGVYDTRQWSPGVISITVPLTGLLTQPRPDQLNLTVRGDETTNVLPSLIDTTHAVDLALQWPNDQYTNWTPISRLQLSIEPEPLP